MIDLSDDSRRALEKAARIAKNKGSELVVLYPYRLKNQQVGEHKVTLKQRLEREAYSRFDSMKQSVSELELVPYTFSPEVGFETDRLEAHLQNKPIEHVYLCKSIALQAEANSDWHSFVKTLQIPVEMVP
jgi:nucleotide-binding universal stress UspA family protein